VSGQAAPGRGDAVRDFAVQLDRTLTVRRLYSPHAGPYHEAMQALERKLWVALPPDGFALRVTPTRLLLGEEVLLERPRDDAFFFPLYRDGLRELAFSPELDRDDLDPLLGAFEAERLRRLAPDEDLVAFLWRCDLQGIRFSAVDGIGDEEGEGGADASPGGDYGALVSELVERIRDPAPPTTGQSYAFVLDADVKLQATDLRYDPTTVRRSFGETPTVFPLTREQADALRGEAARDDEADLLARFVDILLAMALDRDRSVPLAQVVGVLKQLVGGLWQVGEHAALAQTLGRLRAAAEGAADQATRAALGDTLRGLFTPERMSELLRLVQQGGAVDLAQARALWDHAGEEAWGALLDCAGELPDGELAGELRRYLRVRLASRPELLRHALADRRVARVHTALSLVDPRVERVFAPDLLRLVGHADEAVRLRALAAAGRLGGTEAREALWRALQGDSSRQVRLLAFRLLAATDHDELVSRLTALASDAGFGDRPLFERRKVANMLSEALGEEAVPLFVAWLPARRHFLRRGQLETVALVVDVLRDCGEAGRDALGGLSAGRGKVARLARRALGGSSGSGRRGE
jgi:hypothetical protein